MTYSVLDIIRTYSNLEVKELGDFYSSTIGINQAGERLEYFVRDLVCDSFDYTDKDSKDEKHKEAFSWLGSQNHPPDMIIRGSEAIEVKKSRGKHPSIALNSSPPRQQIRPDTLRITKDCVQCEDEIGGWSEKDVLYAIGSRVSKKEIGFMWLVYGDCWCADDRSYLELSETLTDKTVEGVSELDHIEMDTESNEIGKIHKADALSRTNLRIRGMWSLKHPAKYFSQFVDDYESKIKNSQPLFLVMTKARFEEFEPEEAQKIEQNPRTELNEFTAPAPSDPQQTIDCVLIETS